MSFCNFPNWYCFCSDYAVTNDTESAGIRPQDIPGRIREVDARIADLDERIERNKARLERNNASLTEKIAELCNDGPPKRRRS
ncbi:MAG: hypothetical protein ACREE6_14635 [Limisphaerales bacterium]